MSERPQRPGAEEAPTPEEARLGQEPAPVPPADERPDRRGARSSLTAGTYAIFAAGAVLFGAVLIAPDTAGSNAATIVAAVLVVMLGAALLAEVVEPRVIAVIGVLGGLALGISALLPGAIEGPEVGRLVGGALLFLGAGGILASSAVQRDRGGQR